MCNNFSYNVFIAKFSSNLRDTTLIKLEKMQMPDSQYSHGQGILEYALILMLVVIVVIILVYLLGPAVGNMYSNVLVNF